MAAFAVTSKTILLGSAWSGTAPGLPGTQTVSGTISSASDISEYVSSGGEAGTSVNMNDGTTFGSGGFRVQYPGIKSGDTLTFDLVSDFAAAEINAIVKTTLGGIGSLVYGDIKPTSASRGATNPSFVFAAYIQSYTPLMGAAGDLARGTLVLEITGKFDDLTT